MTSRTFVFAGGGSGGHLFPGIAVAEELVARDRRCRIVFVGSDRGIERTILAETGFGHVALPVAPSSALVRRPLRFSVGFATSLRAASRVLDELRPEAVIGLGGFASIPIGLAALRRRVPLILLEQNVVPGRATSLLCRWAAEVCVSFEETASLLPRRTRCLMTGNPLRAEIGRAARATGSTSRRTLLILGGSQGAAGVNALSMRAISMSKGRLTGWKVVHQTGERDAASVREHYADSGLDAEVAAFFPDLPSRYTDAGLVISRAGATTLAELACLGRPAVLVPYPASVRDHQRRNAQQFVRGGAAVSIDEGPSATDRLAATLAELIESPLRLAAMSRAMSRMSQPDATMRVADLILPAERSARAA